MASAALASRTTVTSDDLKLAVELCIVPRSGGLVDYPTPSAAHQQQQGGGNEVGAIEMLTSYMTTLGKTVYFMMVLTKPPSFCLLKKMLIVVYCSRIVILTCISFYKCNQFAHDK